MKSVSLVEISDDAFAMNTMVSEHPTRTVGWRFWAVLVVSVFVLAGCDEGPAEQAERYLASAQEHYQDGDLAAAVIELKNALQVDGRNADARLLLGRMYLGQGNGAAAEKELLLAQEFGKDNTSVKLLLGQAHLLQGDYAGVLAVLPAEPDDAEQDEVNAEVQVARGRAYLGLRSFDEAREAFERSLKLAPIPSSYEGLARLAMFEADDEAAGRSIRAGLDMDPANSALVALDAELAFQRGELAEAKRKFGDALALSPGHAKVRLRLARIAIEQKQYDEAVEQLQSLLAQSPNSIEATQLLSVVAFEQKDYEEALTRARSVLSNDGDNLMALYIAGASSLAINQLEQANRYLTQVTIMAPTNAVARRLLGVAQMRLGEGNKALTSLSQSGAVLEDADDLRAVAGVALQSGNLQGGLRYLEQIADSGSETGDLRLQTGILKIALGNLKEGAADLLVAQNLKPELQGEPTFSQAQGLLIETYLNQGQPEKALAEALKLQQLSPQRPEGFLYEGVARMTLNQPGEGEAAFQKALLVAPGFPPASMGLAEIEASRGNFNAARNYLEQSLAANPDNLTLAMRLAGLAERFGQDREVKKWLERAISSHPDALEPRLSLGNYYLVKGDPVAALSILEQLLPDQEDNPVVLNAIGRAQAGAGKPQAAVETLKHWVSITPDAPQAHLALADAYELVGNADAVRTQLETAAELSPQNAGIQIRLGRLLVAQKDAQGARDAVAKLSEIAPGIAEIKEISAGIAMMENQPARAVSLFEEARGIEDSSRLAIGLAGAKWQAGDTGGAAATLKAWIDRNPEDTNARLIANRYLEQLGRTDEVIANLEGILTYQPQSWVANNNLALILTEQGDLTGAREHAERANALAPGNPSVLDTLGVVLHAQGEHEEALPILREAAAQLPRVAEVQLHLARVLVDTGDADEAKVILQRIVAAQGAHAEVKAEAQRLLNRLGQ